MQNFKDNTEPTLITFDSLIRGMNLDEDSKAISELLNLNPKTITR
jgi:hypothetical protein